MMTYGDKATVVTFPVDLELTLFHTPEGSRLTAGLVMAQLREAAYRLKPEIDRRVPPPIGSALPVRPVPQPERRVGPKLPVWVRRMRGENGGQGLVEYALILALIAIVSIAVLALVGSNIANVLSQLAQAI